MSKKIPWFYDKKKFYTSLAISIAIGCVLGWYIGNLPIEKALQEACKAVIAAE